MLRGAWLEPGMTAVSIGSTLPEPWKADTDAIARADVNMADQDDEVALPTPPWTRMPGGYGAPSGHLTCGRPTVGGSVRCVLPSYALGRTHRKTHPLPSRVSSSSRPP